MRDLDNPTPRFLLRIAPLDFVLLAATGDVGYVPMCLDDVVGVAPPVAGVGAQVLRAALVGIDPCHHDFAQYGIQLRHVIDVRRGHDDR